MKLKIGVGVLLGIALVGYVAVGAEQKDVRPSKEYRGAAKVESKQDRPEREWATRTDDAEGLTRFRVVTSAGVLVIYDAAIPPGGQTNNPGFVAYWNDFETEYLYVFDRLLFTPGDVAVAVGSLQRDFGLDPGTFASDDLGVSRISSNQPATILVLERSEGDDGSWQPASREGILAIMGFVAEEDGSGGVAMPPIPCWPVMMARAIEPLPAPHRGASPDSLLLLASASAGCPPGGGDPPCTGPCCGSADPCCGSSDPCCGNSNPCCGNSDPCCGNPSPCCGSSDPCCGDPCCPDPCYSCNAACCGSSNPCCGNSDPCCGNPDPCCGSPNPCCGNSDPCCSSTNPCCGSSDPCCGSSDPCCGNPNPCCGNADVCCGNPDPCCGSDDACCDPSSGTGSGFRPDGVAFSACTDGCGSPGDSIQCRCVNGCRLSDCRTGLGECATDAGLNLGEAAVECAFACLPSWVGGPLIYKACLVACEGADSLITLWEMGLCFEQAKTCGDSANAALECCLSRYPS